jgi:hypothetical protein
MKLAYSITDIIFAALTFTAEANRLKTLRYIGISVLMFCVCLSAQLLFAQSETMDELIKNRLDRSAEQCLLMAASLKNQPEKLPRTADAEGKLRTVNYADWVSGYFPGTLWYLYEYNKETALLDYARNFTGRIEKAKYDKSKHDIGLMLYCSYGNGFRLTGDKAYRDVLLTGAETLGSRFDTKTGCIKSWNTNKKWQFPVIIDGMMCLELLFCASKESNDSQYKNMCISHADVTLKNHFRNDYSSYHVVSYDTVSGVPEKKNTHQGYADESAWSRGQAWGLYGYTLMYRETNDQKYLEQAKHIAAYILNHPHLPADKIPYWDFNAPEIPNAPRDASAGAVIASALIELSGYVDKPLAENYLGVAETQIRTLSSPAYFAEKGTNGNFILKHSVGAFPFKIEIDVPLTYADYYYVEALLRYRKLLESSKEVSAKTQ